MVHVGISRVVSVALSIVLVLLASWIYKYKDLYVSQIHIIQQKAEVQVISQKKLGLQTDYPYIISYTTGELPDHTIEGYRQIIDFGADFIQCSVVLTKDLVAVCRDEPNINSTTDVYQKYPDRVRTYPIDGQNVTGIFTVDLTYDELQTLRVIQDKEYRSQNYNGMFTIPALQQFIDTAITADRMVGIQVLPLYPSWHNSLSILQGTGRNMTQLVLEVLDQNGYKGNRTSRSWQARPIYFLSMEYNILYQLKEITEIPLVFVAGAPGNITVDVNKTFEEMTSNEALDQLAQNVTGIAVEKNALLPVNEYGYVESSTGLAQRVQRRGMQIFVYTFRNEDQFLAWTWQQDPYLEYYQFIEKEGIDGGYTEFPKTMMRYYKRAREHYLQDGFPATPPNMRVENGLRELLKSLQIKRGQFEKPYIIAHRGACGILPEHTVEGYELAIEQGAHFIECDVVLTKDLVPICRHEQNIISTTNAAQVFPDKMTTKTIDGVQQEGIFAIDLTLSEIKELTANQSLSFRDPNYNGMYRIPTLDEYIKVAKNAGRTVGIYPETKNPTWHDSQDVVKEASTTISDIVLNVLTQNGYEGGINSDSWKENPVFIQSFEYGNLKYLSEKTDIPLVFLLRYPGGKPTYDNNRTYEEMTLDESLDDLATFISAIGPSKDAILYVNPENSRVKRFKKILCWTCIQEKFWRGDFVLLFLGLKRVSYDYYGEDIVERAHKRGLQVHPYTYRNEQQYLANNYISDYRPEYDLFLTKIGVDGVFTDFSGSLFAFLNEKQSLDSTVDYD